MQGANIKINFFEAEIESISELKYKLEKIHELTKDALKSQQMSKAEKNLSRIEEMLSSEIRSIGKEVKKTKRFVNAREDEGQQERKILFESLDSKIDELNDRLYVAEQCVQKAEMIKKKNDALVRDPNSNYQMTNVKSLKKQKEKNQIERFIQAKLLVRNEIKRFITFLFGQNQEEDGNQEQNWIQKIIGMRKSELNFNQLRSEIQNGSQKRPHSAKKYPKIFLPVACSIKRKEKPLIEIILTSPKISQHIDSSILDLTNSTKQNNKRMSRLNKLMVIAQEKKQTNTVWQFLNSRKEQLSLEQSIAKLELDAVKLNENYEERILSLKDYEQLRELNKTVVKCRQWPQKKRMLDGLATRHYKSLEKKSKQGIRRKNKMVSEEEMQKKNESYPHTNDSLSALGKR